MAIIPTAEVTVKTVADRASLRKAEKDITGALRKVEQLSSKGGLLSKSYTQPLGKITGAVGEFEKSLEASNARVIAFGASAGIIYNVTRSIEGMVRSAVQLEHKLAEINVILMASTQGLKTFGNELFSIAKNTGQTFEAVSDSALEFARQGLAVEETLKRTSDAMILTRLSGLDVQSSVEAVTATINSFNQTVITSTALVNKLANVDAAFAVSSADLAKAVSRVGSSAQDAGVSLDQLIAMVTTAQQVTARGGSVIGNSLKTIFTRLQRPKVISDLEAFGVVVRDAQGATLPAIQTLQNFANAYDSLTPSQQAVSAEMVGGVFQVNVLKAAIGDLGKQFSIYDRALGTSVNSTDQAIARNAELNKTLNTLVNESMQNLLKVGASIGNITIGPALRNSLEEINEMLEGMDDQSDAGSIGMKMGKGILEGIGNILKGPGMLILGALVGKLLFSFSKFGIDAVRSFAGMNEGAKKQAEMQMLIQNILLKNPDLIDAARSSEENLVRVSDKILESIRARNFALAQSADLSAAMARNLTSVDLGALNLAMQGGGQTEGAWRPTNMFAGGLVPNFNKKKERATTETIGALQGGYKPGTVKEMNVQGVGRVTYNSAETVKTFGGMSQPAIMPPSGSDAGKAYKQKFAEQHGFNPYAAQGFIPNFAELTTKEWIQKVKAGPKWNESDILEKMYKMQTAEEIAKEYYPPQALQQFEEERKEAKLAGVRLQGGPTQSIRNVFRTGEKSGWVGAPDDSKYAGFRDFLKKQGAPIYQGDSKLGFRFDKGSSKDFKPIDLPTDFKGIDLFGSTQLRVDALKSAAFGAFGKKGLMSANISLDDFFDSRKGEHGYGLKTPKGLDKVFSPNDVIQFSIQSSTIPVDNPNRDDLKASGARLSFKNKEFDKVFRDYMTHKKIGKTKQTQEVKEGRAMEAAVFHFINKMADPVQEDGRRWDFTPSNTVTMGGLAKFIGLSGNYERIDAKRTTDDSGVKLSLARKYIEGTQTGSKQLVKQMQAYKGEDESVVARLIEVLSGKAVKEQEMEKAIAADFKAKQKKSGLKSFGGFVPNFATKILDKDQLAQSMGMPLSSKEVRQVFESIVNQAAQRGQISETIVGTAGIGKTTEAIKRAGGRNFVTDPVDLDPSDQLVVVRAAQTVVDSPEFTKSGKITFLKGAKDVVKGMREKRSDQARAGTSDTNFGRSPKQKFGSSSGVVTEALLAEKYASKLGVFERQADMSLKEAEGFEKLNELKGATATIGAFAPFTKGHADMATQAGADVAFVSKGANREYDVGLSPREKAKLIELSNPNLMAIPSNAGVQEHFEHDGKAYRMRKKDTKIALGADRVSGGKEDLTDRFSKTYKGVVPVKGRLDGVSGTKIRKAIVDGDLTTLKSNLPPEIFRVIKNNIPVLQKRASYIQDRKDKANKGLGLLEEDFSKFKAKHGANKKKGELSEISEARGMFQEKRKAFKARLSGYGGKAWGKLGLNLNLASQGFVPNLAYKGLHEKDYGTTMIGRKGAMGKDMSEAQVKKMTAGMRMIRGPEDETLVVGTDMNGRSGRMIASGLTARKIKKSGAHWRTMLNEVPHLFDGLAYDLVGGVAGADWDPEGTSGAMAGIKFENEMAGALGEAKPGAKKGSDFQVGESIAKKLKTQKNLQLKLALHERSKRDPSKVVDIASSFSKYLVDILGHNIKTHGLSSVTTPDRFQQAMGVLNANPAVKKDWIKSFGPMGMKSGGFVPNFASMDISAMQRHLGVDASSPEFQEWQANRKKRLYDEEQGRLMKGRGVATKGLNSAEMFRFKDDQKATKDKYGGRELESEINPERVAASQNQALRAMGVPEYISQYGTGRIKVPPPGAVSFNAQDAGQRNRLKEKHGIKGDSRPTFNAVWNEEDAKQNVAKRKWAIKNGVSAAEYGKMMRHGGKLNAPLSKEAREGGRNTRFEDSPEMLREERNVTKEEIKAEIHQSASGLASQYGRWGAVFPKSSVGEEYYGTLEQLFKTDHPDYNRILITSTKDFVKKKGLANKAIHGNVVNSDVHGTNMSHELVASSNPELHELESVDFNPLRGRDAGSGYQHVGMGKIPTQGEFSLLAKDQDMIKQYTTELEDMVIQSIGSKAFSMVANQKKMQEFDKMQGASHKAMLQALGTYAEGLVPNFSRDALKEAVGREKAAGQGQPRVGYDRRLGKSGGIGVYNTTEGSLTNAINMHLKGGKSIGEVQTQGASQGHVPNFAGGAMDSAMMMASMGFLASGIKDLGNNFKQLGSEGLKGFDAALDKTQQALEEKEKKLGKTEAEAQHKQKQEASMSYNENALDQQKNLSQQENKGEILFGLWDSSRNEARASEARTQYAIQDGPEAFKQQGLAQVAREAGYEGEAGGAEMWLQSAEGKGKTGEEGISKAIERAKQLWDKKIESLEEEERLANEREQKARELMDAQEETVRKAQKSNENAQEAAGVNKKSVKESEAKLKEKLEAIEEATKPEREARDKAAAEKKKAGKMFGKGGRAMRFIEGGGASNIIATAPMLASQASQFMNQDDLKGKAAVEGAGMAASYAATGAQMGAMAGPWGAAIGGIAGATMGIKSLADGLVKAEIQERGAQVRKELEQVGEALNKVQQSGQKYLESVNKMNQMFKKPVEANPEDLASLQRKMAESITDIPDKFRSQFIAASGDAEKIKEVFAEITTNLQRDKSDLEAATKGFDLQEKFAGEWGDKKIFNDADSLSDRKRIENVAKSQIRSGGVNQDEVLKAIESGKLDVNSIGSFSDIDTSYLGNDFSDFVNTLGTADVGAYTKRIKDYFKELEKGAEGAKKAQLILEDRRKFEEQYSAHLQTLNQELASFSATLGSTVDIIKNKAKTFDEMTRNAQAFNIARAQEITKGSSERAAAYQTEGSKAATQAQTRATGINAKFLKQMQAETSKAAFASLEIPLRKFTEASKKTNELLARKDQNAQGKAQIGAFTRVANSQETLLPVVQKSIKILTNSKDKLADLKKINGEIKQASLDAGYNQLEAQALTDNILKQLEREEESLADKLSIMIQQQAQELTMSAIQADNQKRMIRQTQELKMMGGAGGFEKGGQTMFSKGFDDLATALGSQLKASYSGAQVDQGRADFELLKIIRQSMPMFDMSDNSAAMGLAEGAMVSRAQDIQAQMFMAQRQMAIRTGDAAEARKAFSKEGGMPDPYDIAAKQITSELKLESMSEDIAEMNKNSKVLNVLVGNQSQDLYGQNVKAFDAALKANGVSEIPKGQVNLGKVINGVANVDAAGFLKVDSSIGQVSTDIGLMDEHLSGQLQRYQEAITNAFTDQRQKQKEVEVVQAGKGAMANYRAASGEARRAREAMNAASAASDADLTEERRGFKGTWTGKEARKKLSARGYDEAWTTDTPEFLIGGIATGSPNIRSGQGAVDKEEMDLGGILGAMSYLRAAETGNDTQMQYLANIAKEMAKDNNAQGETFDKMLAFARLGTTEGMTQEQLKLAQQLTAQAKQVRAQGPGWTADYSERAAFGIIPGFGKDGGAAEALRMSTREASVSNMGAHHNSLFRQILDIETERNAGGNRAKEAARLDLQNALIKEGNALLEARNRLSATTSESEFTFDDKRGIPVNLDDVLIEQKKTVQDSRRGVDMLASEIAKMDKTNLTGLESIVRVLDKAGGQRYGMVTDGLDENEVKRMLYTMASDLAGKEGGAGEGALVFDELLEHFQRQQQATPELVEAIKLLRKNLVPETKLKSEGFDYKAPKSPVKPIDTSAVEGMNLEQVASSSGDLSGAMDKMTGLLGTAYGKFNQAWFTGSVIPASTKLSFALESIKAVVDKGKYGLEHSGMDKAKGVIAKAAQKLVDSASSYIPGQRSQAEGSSLTSKGFQQFDVDSAKLDLDILLKNKAELDERKAAIAAAEEKIKPLTPQAGSFDWGRSVKEQAEHDTEMKRLGFEGPNAAAVTEEDVIAHRQNYETNLHLEKIAALMARKEMAADSTFNALPSYSHERDTRTEAAEKKHLENLKKERAQQQKIIDQNKGHIEANSKPYMDRGEMKPGYYPALEEKIKTAQQKVKDASAGLQNRHPESRNLTQSALNEPGSFLGTIKQSVLAARERLKKNNLAAPKPKGETTQSINNKNKSTVQEAVDDVNATVKEMEKGLKASESLRKDFFESQVSFTKAYERYSAMAKQGKTMDEVSAEAEKDIALIIEKKQALMQTLLRFDTDFDWNVTKDELESGVKDIAHRKTEEAEKRGDFGKGADFDAEKKAKHYEAQRKKAEEEYKLLLNKAKEKDKEIAGVRAAAKIQTEYMAKAEENEKFLNKLKDSAKGMTSIYAGIADESTQLEAQLRLFADYQTLVAKNARATAQTDLAKASVGMGFSEDVVAKASQVAEQIAQSFVLRTSAKNKARQTIDDFEDDISAKMADYGTSEIKSLTSKGDYGGLQKDFDDAMIKHGNDMQKIIADTEISEQLRGHLQDIIEKWGTEKEGEVRKLTRQVNFELVGQNFDNMTRMFEEGGVKFEKVTAQYNGLVAGILDGTRKLDDADKDGKTTRQRIIEYNKAEVADSTTKLENVNQFSANEYKASAFASAAQKQTSQFIESPGIRTDAELETHISARTKTLELASKGYSNELQNTIKLYEAGVIPTAQYRQALEKANEAAIEAGEYGFKNLAETVRAGFSYSQQDYFKDINRMGAEFAQDFRTGTASAFGEAIKGTKTLKEAFGDMFKNMADKMLDNALQMGVNSIFDAVLGRGGKMKKGGEVKGYASGGVVNGGSGTKDDVPAYLTKGEYVIRKSAVNAYGQQFFDALNSSNVVTAEKGGAIARLANIRRQELTKARDLRTAGIQSFNYKQFGEKDKEDWLGRKTGEKELETHRGYRVNLNNSLTPQRIEAIKTIAEKYPEVGKNLDRDLFDESSVEIGEGSYKVHLKNKYVMDNLQRPEMGKLIQDSKLSAYAMTNENNPQNKYKFEKMDTFFNYQKEKLEFLKTQDEAMEKHQREKQGRRYGFLFGAASMLVSGALTGGKGAFISPTQKAKGGLINAPRKFAMGGMNSDNVPALLMGGEYVLNKDTVDEYGTEFFDRLNTGKLAKFAAGGLVRKPHTITAMPGSKGASSNDGSGIGGSTTTTNNINIAVNVDSNGNVTADTTDASGAGDLTEQESKELAARIKTSVMDVIIQQKRPGGMLYDTK